MNGDLDKEKVTSRGQRGVKEPRRAGLIVRATAKLFAVLIPFSSFVSSRSPCRMFGPLIYLSGLGSQGLLRQQAQSDEEALPRQLRLLLR